MSITALPTPPQRSDPTNFADRADAFLTALPTFGTEANTLQSDVNAKQATASNAASTATTKAGEAAGSASSAADQVLLAANQVTLATTQVGLATTQANNAAASALTAVNAPGTSATSTTSLTVGTGTQSLTIQTGKSLVVGMYLVVASTASPANNMFGTITSYDAGTGALVVNVTIVAGSGTFANWTVSLSGAQGLQGTAGTPATLSGTTVAAINHNEVDKGTVSTGTVTFTQSVANVQRLQVGGALTIATTGWPTSGTFGELLIKLVNAGAYAVTLPTINWIKPDGTLTTTFATYLTAISRPALQTSGTDFLYLFSDDAGVTIYGKLI